MKLEASEISSFIGMHTRIEASRLTLGPSFPDPWKAASYNNWSSMPLKPWRSWSPPSQKRAVVRSLLCRAAMQSNTFNATRKAMWEALVSLVYCAGFPQDRVVTWAQEWAKTWIPKGGVCTLPEVSRALNLAISDLKRHRPTC